MKEYVFSKPLGVVSAPFGSYKKNDAILAAGLIAGGASLLGSAVSSYYNLKNQADTNAANQSINREQMANQRYLYDQQRADERFLVNQAYERNRPINQVKELREAGINPAFAMDSGSFGIQSAQTGTAPSPPSSSAPIPNQAARMDDLGLGISNAGQLISNSIIQQKEQNRADEALQSDKTYRGVQARTEFLNALTKAKEAGVSEKYINKQIEEMDRRYQFDKSKEEKEAAARDRSLDLDERRVEIQAYEAETSRMAAKAGIALNAAQISKVAQDISESKERVFQMAQNGASQRSIDAFVERQQKATAERLERENERGKRQESTKRRQAYMDFTDWLFTPLKGIVSVGIK